MTAAKAKKWSDEEICLLREYYASTSPDDFSLAALSVRLGRSFHSVALKASRLGLSDKRTDPRHFSQRHRENMSKAMKIRSESIGGHSLAKPLIEHVKKHGGTFVGRNHSEESRAAMSESQKHRMATTAHPRGMAGKSHSQETKDELSRQLAGREVPRDVVMRIVKTKAARGILARPRFQTSWKAAWAEVGGVRFFARSRWEANYARYLEFLKRNGQIVLWEHEPETFWFEKIQRGCVSYLPDFRVTHLDGRVEYHEVKGWMDARSKTKIRRMRIYHPSVCLVVIDSKRYKRLMATLRGIVDGLE
jgi:hypothetical protein